MTALYNENEPFAAQWLRNLAEAGHIAPGAVNDRSIADLDAADVVTATQAHFFAGIGAWSYALRLAGWPDDRAVWTGSCPCQPFSVAGRGRGTADERHLWPVWRDIIAECRPPVVFGEQVASPAGRDWLAAVRADLEALGYAVGAADLCAAGVGAPHIRQRLFWVADHPRVGRGQERPDLERFNHRGRETELGRAGSLHSSPGCRVAHRNGTGLAGRALEQGASVSEWSSAQRGGDRGPDGVEDANGQRQQGERLQLRERPEGSEVSQAAGRGAVGAWNGLHWLPCADGKARPTQPGLHPLAHGAPARVGRLRAYGNAIVPQVAATFIRAFMNTEANP